MWILHLRLPADEKRKPGQPADSDSMDSRELLLSTQDDVRVDGHHDEVISQRSVEDD